MCRGMMVDITALRARLSQLEEEKRSLDQHLNLKHRERNDKLVRQLFSTCVLLKVCKPDLKTPANVLAYGLNL